MQLHAILSKMAISLLLLVLFVVSGNAQCDTHKAIIDNLNKALIEKNPDILAKVYHADAKRQLADASFDGLAAIQEEVRKFYADVPDASAVYEDVICSGDKIIRRWTGSGTPKNLGKEIKVTGITIYQVKDGKVIREWEEMSTLSFMQQMGFELKPPGEK